MFQFGIAAEIYYNVKGLILFKKYQLVCIFPKTWHICWHLQLTQQSQ